MQGSEKTENKIHTSGNSYEWEKMIGYWRLIVRRYRMWMGGVDMFTERDKWKIIQRRYWANDHIERFFQISHILNVFLIHECFLNSDI